VKAQFWVLVTTILVLGLLAGATDSCNSTSQPGAQTAPTVTNRLLERPVLGSTDSTFVSKFGKPVAHTITSSGATEETFATGNKTIKEFDVYLESTDPNLVYGITITAPVEQPWHIAAGMALCNSYLPSDTIFGKPRIITNTDGVQNYYREGNSAALAASSDPSDFFDGGNHQLVTPGTVNASYYYADTQGFTISLCALSFGTTADVK
jgi:hypothetical protein